MDHAPPTSDRPDGPRRRSRKGRKGRRGKGGKGKGRFLLPALALLIPGGGTPPARGEVPPILSHLERYFSTEEGDERQEIVKAIEAESEYDRRRLGEWLHQMEIYPAFKPGRANERIDVGFGHRRMVTLRIPKGYDPARPWPLLLAFHPSGGNGPSFLSRAESILGDRVNDYVIVAPTHYRQTVFDAPPPFTPEHPVMLRWLRRQVHVDSDRVHILGYSLGGYTAWTLSGLHADLYAGAVALASTYSAPVDVEGLWEAFLPNHAHLPILHVWGERDGLGVPGFDGRVHSGTMSELNRRLRPLFVQKGLGNVLDRPVPGAGHGGFGPPRDEFDKVLGARRVHYPRRVEHRFRHLHQGRAYWLEAVDWVGEQWGLQRIDDSPGRGESRAQALGRRILPLLGELQGEIDGQTVTVTTRHVGTLDVWFGDGMIDWDRPVTVKRDGKVVFNGKLVPDLALCLAEAERTRDFRRLRWAGLRIDAAGTARLRKAGDPVTPLIREP